MKYAFTLVLCEVCVYHHYHHHPVFCLEYDAVNCILHNIEHIAVLFSLFAATNPELVSVCLFSRFGIHVTF